MEFKTKIYYDFGPSGSLEVTSLPQPPDNLMLIKVELDDIIYKTSDP